MPLPVPNRLEESEPMANRVIPIRRAAPTHHRDSEHRLRWVLAHDPPVVWEDAADVFTETVRERTDGAIRVELSVLSEFSRTAGRSIDRLELIRSVGRGEVEMAHAYVSALGVVNNLFWALELPFLFRDYAHAEAVIEGDIATRFLEALAPQGMLGLAFAYSGGFRIIPSRRAIHSLEDFHGLRIRTAENPIPGAVFDRLGATAAPAPLEQIPALAAAGTIDAAEITYVRFVGTGMDSVYRTINDTGHSLFMTAMVINRAFFEGLPEAYQQALVEAAQAAARVERATSIHEEGQIKDRAAEQGLRIVRMDAPEHAALREQALAVYDTYGARFGGSLVQDIRDA
jgi:TRAP-type C4-dicarboxylate transport system substrate-binding protein